MSMKDRNGTAWQSLPKVQCQVKGSWADDRNLENEIDRKKISRLRVTPSVDWPGCVSHESKIQANRREHPRV
jgi:hypothetical protein